MQKNTYVSLLCCAVCLICLNFFNWNIFFRASSRRGQQIPSYQSIALLWLVGFHCFYILFLFRVILASSDLSWGYLIKLISKSRIRVLNYRFLNNRLRKYFIFFKVLLLLDYGMFWVWRNILCGCVEPKLGKKYWDLDYKTHSNFVNREVVWLFWFVFI